MFEALNLLEKARTQTIVLREFLTQWEQVTNNQILGVNDILNEIDAKISTAYVLIASENNRRVK